MKVIKIVCALSLCAVNLSVIPMDKQEKELIRQIEERDSIRPQQQKFGKAIRELNVALVKSMLETEKINPNDICFWDFDFIPLVQVVYLNCLSTRNVVCREIVDLLLKHKADINLTEPISRKCATFEAAHRVDHNLFEHLLELGGDPAIEMSAIFSDDSENHFEVRDSYWQAKDMLERANIQGPLQVLRKHKDRIKQEIAATASGMPKVLIKVVAEYLFCTDLVAQEKSVVQEQEKKKSHNCLPGCCIL